MWLSWTSTSLGASYYSSGDVRSAGDHGIDELTNAISVAKAILLLDLEVGIGVGRAEIGVSFSQFKRYFMQNFSMYVSHDILT
jgi:hypothetical protein